MAIAKGALLNISIARNHDRGSNEAEKMFVRSKGNEAHLGKREVRGWNHYGMPAVCAVSCLIPVQAEVFLLQTR